MRTESLLYLAWLDFHLISVSTFFYSLFFCGFFFWYWTLDILESKSIMPSTTYLLPLFTLSLTLPSLSFSVASFWMIAAEKKETVTFSKICTRKKKNYLPFLLGQWNSFSFFFASPLSLCFVSFNLMPFHRQWNFFSLSNLIHFFFSVINFLLFEHILRWNFFFSLSLFSESNFLLFEWFDMASLPFSSSFSLYMYVDNRKMMMLAIPHD